VRGQRHAPAALYLRERPVPICVQEAGWASGSVWTGAENIASTGIRYSDHPVRRQSLYRLSYPAHNSFNRMIIYNGGSLLSVEWELNLYIQVDECHALKCP